MFGHSHISHRYHRVDRRFRVALAGLLGYASAQSSTSQSPSGDSALPTESRAVLGADSARRLWPRVFHLDGNVSPASWMSRITGYVYNDYGQAAEDVELKMTTWIRGSAGEYDVPDMSDTVPSRGRGYFDLQVPVSRSYEVNVESFDFTMGGSN